MGQSHTWKGPRSSQGSCHTASSHSTTAKLNTSAALEYLCARADTPPAHHHAAGQPRTAAPQTRNPMQRPQKWTRMNGNGAMTSQHWRSEQCRLWKPRPAEHSAQPTLMQGGPCAAKCFFCAIRCRTILHTPASKEAMAGTETSVRRAWACLVQDDFGCQPAGVVGGDRRHHRRVLRGRRARGARARCRGNADMQEQ